MSWALVGEEHTQAWSLDLNLFALGALGSDQDQSTWGGQALPIPAEGRPELSAQGGAALQPCRSSDGEEQWLCED